MKLSDVTQEFKDWMLSQGAWEKYVDNFDKSFNKWTDTQEDDFILHAFLWEKTEQGTDYWLGLNRKWKEYLDAKRDNPDLPIHFIQDALQAKEEMDNGEVSEYPSALSTQVGGEHYKTMKVQPIELAYSLGGTPCFTKLAKYLTRDKGERKVDLEKALHVIELEEELFSVTTDSNYYGSMWNSCKACDILFVTSRILEFTDNILIQQALICMYYRNYEDAKMYVKRIMDEAE